jgi:hypothetical protein
MSMSRSGVMFLLVKSDRKHGMIPMTLRNFGLSFSRHSPRPNPGVSWRPKRRHVGGATIVVVVLLLLALAMI